MTKIHKRYGLINYLSWFLLFYFMLIFSFNNICYSQDLFLSKYKLDRQSIASIALLIYESPIFILPDSIKIFINNNKEKFEKLSSIYLKFLNNDLDLEIDHKIYDSCSASIEFERIKSVFENLEFDEFKFFLIDLANLLFTKDDLCSSLEIFFKETAKENISFSIIPVKLTTNENLFLHIKDPKKSIEHYIFYKTDNLNNLLFELLSFVFKQRLFFTTILPKSIEFSKAEQTKYLNLTGRSFLYPEAEAMLESAFVLYSLNSITDLLNKYTGLSIKENIEAKTFYYKLSWLNEIIKRWDSLNNNSIFKFPKPYGMIFVDFIKNNDDQIQSDTPFNKLLQLNPDLISIVSLTNDLGISEKQKNLIQKKLLNIGFSKVIFKYDYDKDISNFLNKKVVFIYLMKKSSENISPFFILNKDMNFQLQNIYIKSFSEISTISYFDNINILLLVNKPTTDSFMKAINLIVKLKSEPIIVKRNFFQRIIDSIIAFFSPLSL